MDYYREVQSQLYPYPGTPVYPPGGGFPGGGVNQRLRILENQVAQLSREVRRLDRRVQRLERRFGMTDFYG